jgi:hypothetical protein
MRSALKALNNIHIPSGDPDVFIFASARSGSTLMHELILTQPGFKPCKVPFDLRYEPIARHLATGGIRSWADLYTESATDVIHAYVRGISSGKIHISDPFFFRNRFRLFTRRIAFKILHACEDRIGWFNQVFNGRIVYLLRHPIPVSFSRRQIPRLEVFVTSDYSRHFSRGQLEFARKVIDSGTDMERAVLDWCLQNSVALRQVADDWTIVSYEQLVLDPEPVVARLAKRLDLPRPERMLARLKKPSYSTKWSDDKTKKVLEERLQVGEERADKKLDTWLIEKWREKVDDDEERRLMKILEVFELDLYRHGDSLPASRFWIRSQEAA